MKTTIIIRLSTGKEVELTPAEFKELSKSVGQDGALPLPPSGGGAAGQTLQWGPPAGTMYLQGRSAPIQPQNDITIPLRRAMYNNPGQIVFSVADGQTGNSVDMTGSESDD